MKLVDVDPLIVKLNEAQIEGTDTYKGLGLAKEMLIRAKGINPSTDAVSREAVLDIVNNPLNIRLDEIIKKLPPVTPETKSEWVPVSERLPEERGLYIVTEKEFRIDDREHKGKYSTKVEQVEYYNGRWQRANFFEVIAWQPLPEPYKGVSE